MIVNKVIKSYILLLTKLRKAKKRRNQVRYCLLTIDINDKDKMAKQLNDANKQINLHSLKDAKNRLENLKNSLSANRDLIAYVNIENTDPSHLWESNQQYSKNFNSLSNSNKEIMERISMIE